MVTSSAVVGSSAIKSFGLQASAMAIITRWLMPPDSWCGIVRPGDLSGAGHADQAQELDRALAALPCGSDPGAAAGVSPSWKPTVKHGFRLRHRLLEDHRHVLADDPAALSAGNADAVPCPSKVHAVSGDLRRPGQKPHHARASQRTCRSRIRRRSTRISPLSQRERSRRRRRGRGRTDVWNSTVRSLNIEKWHQDLFSFGIERVAQPVAHQVDGEHGRRGWQGPGNVTTHQARWMNSRASAEHRAPFGCRRLGAHAEKAEGGSIEDRRREGERRLNDQRPATVRQDCR